MLGEVVSFERHGQVIEGLVYIYAPGGNKYHPEPFIRVRRLPVTIYSKVYVVDLDDPSLSILTIDRETGARMEEEYNAGSPEDSSGTD